MPNGAGRPPGSSKGPGLMEAGAGQEGRLSPQPARLKTSAREWEETAPSVIGSQRWGSPPRPHGSPGRQDVRPRPHPAPSLSAAALSDMTSDYRHRSRAHWLPLPNWAIILTNVSLWVSRWQKNRSPLCPPRTALRPPPSPAPPWRSAFSSHAAGSLTCWPRGPCRVAGQRGRRQVSPHGLSAAGNARVQTAFV